MRAQVSIYIIRYYQNGIYCSQVKLIPNPSDTLTFYPEPLRGSNDLYSTLQTAVQRTHGDLSGGSTMRSMINIQEM